MRIAACMVLLVTLSSPLGAQEGEAEPRTFTLLGQVLDHQAETPVAGALVEVRELKRRTVADSAGRFAFPDLPEGSYTFETSRIGYIGVAEASEVRSGNVLLVRLLPQPIVLEGIEVTTDRMERRRRSSGIAVRAHGREDLLASSASTVAQFLKSRTGMSLVPCSHDPVELCARIRGWPRRVRVFVNEVQVPGGAEWLETYRPDDLYHVEVYPSAGMIRLYEPWFIEDLAKTGRSLEPICIVC